MIQARRLSRSRLSTDCVPPQVGSPSCGNIMVKMNKLLSFEHTQSNADSRLREVDYLSFSKILDQVGHKQAWHEKWKLICDELTRKETPTGPFFSCWIICQNHKHLRFVLNYHDWYSNITCEYCHCGGKLPKKKTHYAFIRIYEEGAIDSRPIFNLRTDISGENGELVWLQKGQTIQGVNIIQIFQLIEKAFPTRIVYLQDDAKFRVESTSSINEEIQIKTLRSVALDYSWYESMRFEAIDVPTGCWTVKGDQKNFYQQSQSEYRDAIKRVQETPIRVLKENFAQSDTLRKKWNNLFGNSSLSTDSEIGGRGRRVPKGTVGPWTRARCGAKSKGFVEMERVYIDKKLNLVLNRRKNGSKNYITVPCRRKVEPKVVKDVVTNIYKNSRKPQKRLGKIVSDQDLSLCYDLFLTSQARHIRNPTAEYMEYANALDVIDNTKLFARVDYGSLPPFKLLKEMPPPHQEKASKHRKAFEGKKALKKVVSTSTVEQPCRKKMKKPGNFKPKLRTAKTKNQSKKGSQLKELPFQQRSSRKRKKPPPEDPLPPPLPPPQPQPRTQFANVKNGGQNRPASRKRKRPAKDSATTPASRKNRKLHRDTVVDQVQPIQPKRSRGMDFNKLFSDILKKQPKSKSQLKKRKNSTSRYRGVHWSNSSGKYGAQWQKGGSRFLGTYPDEEEAAYRWDRECNKFQKYTDELNFPRLKQLYDIEVRFGIDLKRAVVVQVLKMKSASHTWCQISEKLNIPSEACKQVFYFFKNHRPISNNNKSRMRLSSHFPHSGSELL